MTNKQKYAALCESDETITFSSTDWWLDAVAADKWDVALVESDGEVIAALPYVKQSKAFFKLLNMPRLTPYLCPWIRYNDNQKYSNRLSYEHELLTQLITKLPRFDYFSQRFHPKVGNCLPFYWKGFEQRVRYTYVLNDLSDLDRVYADFKGSIRTDIKKAEKAITVSANDDIEEFYKLNKLAYDEKNIIIPRSLDFVKKLDEACKIRGCRKIFWGKDANGSIHGAVYVVWDAQTCYYLMSGRNPAHKNTGLISLLLWEAIKLAASMNKGFNFEGSMIPSVEKFFRAFGAVQTPYYHLQKRTSGLLIMQDAFQKLFKRSL